MFVYKHRVTTCFYYHDNTVRSGASAFRATPADLNLLSHAPSARVWFSGVDQRQFLYPSNCKQFDKETKDCDIMREDLCARVCSVYENVRFHGIDFVQFFLSFKLIKKPKTCVQTEHINVGARFFTMKQTLCVETGWCGRSVKTLLLCRSSWCDLCL